MNIETSRRNFLMGSAAAGAALVIGINAKGVLAAGNAAADLNPFVRISPEGVVHVAIKHFEMGQGTTTGLATLVAEELDADWDTLAVDLAPADNPKYMNLFFQLQATGGSTAIANSYMQYRKAGAAAREVLVAAAADTWGVPAGDVTIENGILKSGNHSAHFGKMVAKAATMTPSEDPAVKDPSAFRLIGMDGLPRKDTKGKTNGQTTFAMDVKVPGMVTAVILNSPRFGGTVKSFDAAGAKDVPGFIDARALPNGAGVAVYARNTWSAMQSRDAITAEWDFSAAENRSTDAMVEYHRGLLANPEYTATKGTDLATAGAAIEGADKVIEAEFVFPNLAHAPMEPLNCVIEPTEAGVRFYDGCQMPGLVQLVIAQVLQMEPQNVEVQTVYAGGSFGRRATPGCDYQVVAAMAFAVMGGKTPVKLVWNREDDIRGGFYRPMSVQQAKVGIKDGKIVGWEHRIAAKSIFKGTGFESMLVHDGIDHESVISVSDTLYSIPNMGVGLSDAQSQVPVLWWRSVGNSQNSYAMEVLMDMAAEAASVDSVEFRLSMLTGGAEDQSRVAGVLKLAAEKAGWGTPGKHLGVAVQKSFNTYVAEIAEVSVTDGKVKLERITCAVDCGTVVNPDIVRAQMEGSIGYGLGAVMRNQITFTDGEVDQSNFPDYEPLRITDMPVIDVHIVGSTLPPTGVGEPGLPPVGPAVANAIFAATGKRITTLPMTESGIEFA